MKLVIQITILFLFSLCGCHKEPGLFNNQEHNLTATQIARLETRRIPVFKKISDNKISIEKMGGWSNFTYLISLPENKKFVLRIPKKGPSKLKALLKRYSRDEYVNSKQAYSLGIGAKIEFFDASKNIFLLKYIENERTLEETDFHNTEILKEATLLLKKLHSSKVRFNNDVNMFLTLEQLASFFNATYKNNTPGDLNVLMSIVRKVRHVFRHLHLPSVPCHNDPNPDNFLLTNKGITLVDWEYSGNNDPAWDLALLSATGNFNHNQDLLMLTTYGHQKDELLPERFIVYKALVQLWRFFWVRFQAENIDDLAEKQRFVEMSNQRYNNCKEIMQSKEFRNSLDKLAK